MTIKFNLMSKEKIVASLDIGSSKIRTVIALMEEERKMPNIIGVGVSPSTGMRKGNIIDVDETISNISAALEDAERMSGAPIHHVFVGISGNHIESFDSKGVIAISHAGSEIIEDDINRVLEAAQAVSLPSNRRILRIIPKSFSVDDQKGIKNPVGMIGVRLEVDAHIMTGQATIVKNLEKAVHQAGPLDDKTRALIKLGISTGARLEGAVHSHVRKALDAGATPAELKQVALLALPTIGLP